MADDIHTAFDKALAQEGLPTNSQIEKGILQLFGPEGLERFHARQQRQRDYIDRMQLEMMEGPKGPSTH